MATLNLHTAPSKDQTSRSDDDALVPADTPRRARRHRKPAPHSRVAYAVGITTVCAMAAFELVVGGPSAFATADPQEQSSSVAVAAALGIDGAGIEAPAPEDDELLGQLAASRATRDAEEAAAASSQAQAEQAAAAARAEAEAKAAAEAAAAAAAAEAAAAAAAAEAAGQPSPSTAATAVAVISNSAGPVRPAAQAAADKVVSNVPGAGDIRIGGTRASAADPGGHPSGLALDWMVLGDNALGDAIVDYHIAHWDELGVDYIIYRQRILQSPGGSWSGMADRGSATANHFDHVHVNYVG